MKKTTILLLCLLGTVAHGALVLPIHNLSNHCACTFTSESSDNIACHSNSNHSTSVEFGSLNKLEQFAPYTPAQVLHPGADGNIKSVTTPDGDGLVFTLPGEHGYYDYAWETWSDLNNPQALVIVSIKGQNFSYMPIVLPANWIDANSCTATQSARLSALARRLRK